MENHQKPLLLQHVILKGDNKEVPVHAMKAFTRIGGIAPLILNLDTGWSSVINFMPQPLYPREITLHTLNGRALTGLNILEKRQISCPCQESNPIPSTLQPSHYSYRLLDVFKPFITLEVLVL
jgi:hypothetical protein